MAKTENDVVETKSDIELLSKINSELLTFIKNSLKAESFWDKWTTTDFRFKRIACWEIKDCKNEGCPSFHDTDYKCWLKVGTLCGDIVQGDFAKKYRTCFECDVLKLISSEPLRSLYENINILIHHLKKKEEKLFNSAIRDQLTGVYNRTYFNEYIKKIMAHSNRYGEIISLIMIDINDLKQLNEKYGSQAGDNVIFETARIIISTIRKADVVFRYEGDKFLVVLPHLNLARAEALILRLQEAVEKWNADFNIYENFRLSINMGCSTWKTGDNMPAKINEAYNLMHASKKRKNQILTE